MKRQRGFTMIEVLMAMIVIAVGLLGIAALQGHSSRAEAESYQRAQALVLVGDMLNRIEANRFVKECYATGDKPSHAGTGQVGTYGCVDYGVPKTQAVATNDLLTWHNLLLGSAESGSGAMINAYGCISSNGIDTLTVSVFWQGLSATVDSNLPAGCAGPDYGAGMRRGVSRSVRLPDLTVLKAQP